MIRQLFSLLAIGFMALASGGCWCHPTSLTISIDMDKSLRDDLGNRPLQVDIVGLSANQHAQFQSYSMTKYWDPNDSKRNDLKVKTIILDPTKPGPVVFSADDPAWKTWDIWDPHNVDDKSMPRLYIMVQLPPINGTGWKSSDDQTEDPRRQILPLGDCRWKETKDVHILIQKTGVITQTQYVRDNKNQ